MHDDCIQSVGLILSIGLFGFLYIEKIYLSDTDSDSDSDTDSDTDTYSDFDYDEYVSNQYYCY